MMGRGMTNLSHPDQHMLRIISDEADVQLIVKQFWKMTGRPVDPNESDFVSISTRTLCPPDVARHILDGPKKLALKRTRNSS